MIELRFKNIQSHQVESLSDLLLSLGSVSVSLLDSHDCPVLEPKPGETPLWPEVNINALFIDEDSLITAEAIISEHLPQYLYNRQVIEPQDWINAWKAEAKRIEFGSRLIVCPSHLASSQPNSGEIILDPGLAFGTGSHPTTALCLQWLDRHAQSDTSIIDFGCGTGILMIAALKLGAKHAYGIDIDPQALDATKINALNNHIMPDLYTLSLGDNLNSMPKVDVIMANILLNPLLQLQNQFKNLLNKSGSLVVSGILIEQIDTITAAYLPNFVVNQTQTLDQWALIEFQPKM